MIHLTVAAPMGIDSVFFSFIERLAVQNGHVCVDPPAQQLDEGEPASWIEVMRYSSQHHFVIGYRYPPSYWKMLAESASTVCLLADPDGIARQVQGLSTLNESRHIACDIQDSIEPIRHAIERTIELAEWIFTQNSLMLKILPPASAFITSPQEGFRRIEEFYRSAGVNLCKSCFANFSKEAIPLINLLQPASPAVLQEISRLLSIEQETPSRMNAISSILDDVSDCGSEALTKTVHKHGRRWSQ